MNILVTGASGVVGTATIGALLQAGHSVRAAVRREGLAFPAGVEIVRHRDLTERIDWSPLLNNIEAVVHLAATADMATAEKVNHLATAGLARAARIAGVKRFLYVSSIRAQIGLAAGHIVAETDQPVPADAYGRSKLAAELAVRAEGPGFTILRPVAVFGQGMRGNLATLIGLARLPVPLPFGAFTNRRSILSLENMTDVIVFVLTAEHTVGEIYNVADLHPVTIREIFCAVRHGLGRKPMLFPIPRALVRSLAFALGRKNLWDRLGEELIVSPGKLLRAGWQPATATATALARVAQNRK